MGLKSPKYEYFYHGNSSKPSLGLKVNKTELPRTDSHEAWAIVSFYYLNIRAIFRERLILGQPSAG